MDTPIGDPWNVVAQVVQQLETILEILTTCDDRLARVIGCQMALLIPLIKIQTEIGDAPSLESILRCTGVLSDRMIQILEARVVPDENH